MAHCIGPLVPPKEEQGPWRITLAPFVPPEEVQGASGAEIGPCSGIQKGLLYAAQEPFWA